MTDPVDLIAQTPPASMTIVYDGECPFCTRYIQMVRLREVTGPVELVDARQPHPILAEIKARNLDLDQGMVVRLDQDYFHGAAAITAISLMSTKSGGVNRIMRAIFRRPRLAKLLYPMMVRGRSLTLRMLGRDPIGG